jgi:hypothetical protein
MLPLAQRARGAYLGKEDRGGGAHKYLLQSFLQKTALLHSILIYFLLFNIIIENADFL